MRGPNSLSIEAFVEQMDVWNDLKYFSPDNTEAKTKGFKTKSTGAKVIGRLWRYLETLDDEKDTKDKGDLFVLESDPPCVNESNLKMTFELRAIKEENKEEELEDDVSAEEEKDATPFKIEVRINGSNDEANKD